MPLSWNRYNTCFLQIIQIIYSSHLRYIKSYHDLRLNEEPNFEFLGHPINSYHLVRHVAFAYEHVAAKVGPVVNSTKEFLGNYIGRLPRPIRFSDLNSNAIEILRFHVQNVPQYKSIL